MPKALSFTSYAAQGQTAPRPGLALGIAKVEWGLLYSVWCRLKLCWLLLEPQARPLLQDRARLGREIRVEILGHRCRKRGTGH